MSLQNEDSAEPRMLAHSICLSVRWGDMDALGHVNNAVYLTYFDQARISWWQQHRMFMPNMNTGPIIAAAECKYLKPITAPANLLINVYVGTGRRSSYTVYYEIFDNDHNDVMYATGSTVVVWVDYTLGKSVELPEEVRRHLLKP